MVNTLLIVMSFTFFSTAGVPHLVQLREFARAGVMRLNQEFAGLGAQELGGKMEVSSMRIKSGARMREGR